MNSKDFFKTWEGTQIANKYSGLVILMLSISLILVSFVATTQSNIITVVPANFSEEMTIEQRQASASFKESWGLFFASLIGNTTPKNIEFVVSRIGRSMDPALFRRLNSGLLADVEKLKSEGVSTSFTPHNVIYSPQDDKTFVTGTQDTLGRDAIKETITRTYEMTIKVKNYQAILTHFDAYEGGAKYNGTIISAPK